MCISYYDQTPRHMNKSSIGIYGFIASAMVQRCIGQPGHQKSSEDRTAAIKDPTALEELAKAALL